MLEIILSKSKFLGWLQGPLIVMLQFWSHKPILNWVSSIEFGLADAIQNEFTLYIWGP